MLREQHSEDAKRTARSTVRANEEARMPKEDHILTLKNGQKAFARAALAYCDGLRHMLQHHPHHFNVLLSMMKHDPIPQPHSQNAAMNESIKFLRSGAYLEKNGSLRAGIRDVLESSYQVTADGPVLAQPFLLATDADKAIAERADKELDDWFDNGLRGLFDDDEDCEPSR